MLYTNKSYESYYYFFNVYIDTDNYCLYSRHMKYVKAYAKENQYPFLLSSIPNEELIDRA